MIVVLVKAALLLQLGNLRLTANGQEHLELTNGCLRLGTENRCPAINGNHWQLKGKDN